MENICYCCKVVTEQNKLIKCCICKNNYKHTCAGLTLNEVKITSSKAGLSYTCPNCATIGQDINELKAVIAELKNEVAELKSRNSAPPNNNINNDDFNNIVHEVIERQKRSKNIIIYGLKENSNNDQHVRLTHDTENVKNILNFLSVDTSNADIKPIRLGKLLTNTGKPRPIKITFKEEQAVQNITYKARQLKNSEYSYINISPDRTPKQIEHYKSLLNQLNERKANGETNLAIKYINGIPTIKSLN